jgi:hypothetical protein
MLGVSVAEEPAMVDEAFRDPRRVAAMDAEYNALLHNKTWHLCFGTQRKKYHWLQVGVQG